MTLSTRAHRDPRSRRFSPLLVLLLAAVPVSAQTPVTADSGTLVRMHTAAGPVVGRLTAGLTATDSVVRFCAYPGPPCDRQGGLEGRRALSRDAISRIELSQGNHGKRGAVIGGVFGALIGGGLGSFAAAMCSCRSQAVGVVTGGVATGLVFAGIGATLGSGFPRW